MILKIFVINCSRKLLVRLDNNYVIKINTFMCLDIYIKIYICMYVYVYMYTYVCVYIYMYILIFELG